MTSPTTIDCTYCGAPGGQHKMSCPWGFEHPLAGGKLTHPGLEADPFGVEQHAPGAKLDSGKVDMALVFDGFAKALLEVGKVATFGAAKYTRDGWKSVPEAQRRYRAAGDRHRLKRFIEGPCDDDSKLLHLAHETWNKLAELEKYLEETPIA